MKRFGKRLLAVFMCLTFVFLLCPLSAKADDYVYQSDDIKGGGTDKGDTNKGKNHYRFDYVYDSGSDSICLVVTASLPVKAFGDKTTHIFHEGDTTVIPSQNPSVGKTLYSAVIFLIRSHSINMTVDMVVSKLNDMGYYDDGTGIFRGNGGYLTWVSSTSIGKVVPDVPSAGGDDAHYVDVPDPNDPDKTIRVRDSYVHDVVFDSAVSGAYNLPSNFTKTDGTPVQIKSDPPLCNGYHFDYYSSTIDHNFVPGETYTHNQKGGTVTITAHWLSYINYDCNSGLSTLSSDINAGIFERTTLHDGNAVSVTNKPVATINGHDISKSVIFIGWNTKRDGSGTWYGYSVDPDTNIPNESDGTFSYGGGDITLYAQYRLKYDVLYNGNSQSSGDDFTETLDDPMNITASTNTFEFPVSPFTKSETVTEWDDNLRKDVENTYKYLFQGWSLDSASYFKTDHVYKCDNPNRPYGNVHNANIRDYLSECLSWNPCLNISVSDGYLTVTTYAVWDKQPYVFGYDLSYSKQELENLEPLAMYNMFLRDCSPVSYDREDELHAAEWLYTDDSGTHPYNKRPSVFFANFKASDFVPQDDFGSCTLDLETIDTCGNVSMYRITVHTTTNQYDRSKDGSDSQAPFYTRFIDEDNYQKSFDNYASDSKSLKDITGRTTAYDDGGLEPYSKWLMNTDDSSLLSNALSQMKSDTFSGYASSITLDYDNIISVRSSTRNYGVGNPGASSLDDMLFSGSLNTSSDLKDNLENDSEGHKKYTETIDSNRPSLYKQGYGY